jgi:hypothetical protein
LGYGVIRKSFEGYRIGPLYGNAKYIALDIFKYLIGKIGTDDTIFIDIPSINTKGT